MRKFSRLIYTETTKQMLPNKRVFLLTIFLLVLLCGWSQQSEQFSFTHYKLTDGLASNIVNNLVQDESGYIWISTNNGLQRFDGNKFTSFKSSAGNTSALPSDEVTQVYQDKNKNLWVTTADNKVGIFNTKTFRYKEVLLKQWTKESVHVDKRFIETADGRLLLHLKKTNKLFQYNATENAFVPSSYIHFPHNWKVNFLLQDHLSQKFYMATDSGFVVYSPKTRLLNYHQSNPEKDPLIEKYGTERFVNYLFIDANRRLFFEQWTKSNVHPLLKVLDLKTGVKTEYNLKKSYGLGYHQIKALLEQRNGRLWIYGLPFLAIYANGSNPLQLLKKDYNKEKDLKFNQVFSMYEDRQQNIWICTDNGIYLFNPDAQLFHNYTLTTPKRHTVEGRAQTALQLSNGEIWVGYRDLGLHRYDQQLHSMPLPSGLVPLQDMKSVWDIHQHSKDGKLWIALQGGQLIVYDTLSRKAQLLKPTTFEQRAVTQITEDKAGNLWFGTQAGNLVKWHYKSAVNKDGFFLIEKTGVIEKLLTDNKGFIWVAAFGEGLLKLDPVSNKVLHRITQDSSTRNSLWNNDPKDMIQYNDSLLIVASGALNLVNLNTHEVKHINNHDGLPSNTVQSLAKDVNGKLWLGTLNGLCMADMQKLSFAVYNQSDGLLNESFNVAGANLLNDGRMLFTSAESFVVFNPADTRRKDAVAKAVLTNFQLMNHSLAVDSLLTLKQISLDYDKTNLMVEFNALNYTKLNKLDYYYQLEGFDTAWVKSDERHQAIYTFLPPGNYKFRIKTKNLDGVFGPEVTYLNILVTPPFWKTGWFYLLVLLLVVLIVYLIDRERIKRLSALYDVRTDIASHLHLDVSTTLNNINVLSQIAKLKVDKDIVRSKELIDEISGKSYNMMISMDEILWSIDPSNDTMEKTLLRISELAETLKTNSGTAIDIMVHEKVKDLQLDMKVRHEFFLICKTALQKLAQCAEVENITVDIDLVRSRILVKVLSVGGKTSENTAHIQELRKIIAEKATAMQASYSLEMGKRDTSIILSIPVKRYFLFHKVPSSTL